MKKGSWEVMCLQQGTFVRVYQDTIFVLHFCRSEKQADIWVTLQYQTFIHLAFFYRIWLKIRDDVFVLIKFVIKIMQ